MPNYKTHDKVAHAVAPFITAVAWYVSSWQIAVTLLISFLLANRYLSPDLDIDSIMRRRWGILYIVWIPYRYAFHHRSIWTHSGPLSATIRFIYVSVLLVPLWLYYIPPWEILFIMYIGMVLADSVHSLLDLV